MTVIVMKLMKKMIIRLVGELGTTCVAIVNSAPCK